MSGCAFKSRDRDVGGNLFVAEAIALVMVCAGEDALDPKLFISFAKFEERCREVERARMIYKYALDNLAKEDAADLYAKFMAFEKQYGDVEGIEDAILGKRRFQYEQVCWSL